MLLSECQCLLLGVCVNFVECVSMLLSVYQCCQVCVNVLIMYECLLNVKVLSSPSHYIIITSSLHHIFMSLHLH